MCCPAVCLLRIAAMAIHAMARGSFCIHICVSEALASHRVRFFGWLDKAEAIQDSCPSNIDVGISRGIT